MSKRVLLAAAAASRSSPAGSRSSGVVIVPSPPSSGGIETDLSGVTTVRTDRAYARLRSRRIGRRKPTAAAGSSSAATRSARSPASHQPRHPDQAALGAGARRLHGVPAELLRRAALREHVQGPHVRDRRARPGRCSGRKAGAAGQAVDAGDRGRPADRLVARRHGDRARPRRTARSSGSCRTARRSSPRRSRSATPPTSAPPTAACSRSNVANGHVRWAYNTGGRINSSPSILGQPDLHHDVRGLDPSASTASTATEALEHLHQARLLRVRELLREPLDRRQRLFTISRSGRSSRCARRTATRSGRTT